MAEPLSHAKLEQMFAAFSERPTVEHVSRTCGVHHATVRKYRKTERWDERLAEVRKHAQDEADYDLAQAMAESLRLVREYKRQVANALEGKRVAARDVTAAELERLIRLEAFVLGGVESRHEIVTDFAGWSDEELEVFARDGTVPRRAGRSTT